MPDIVTWNVNSIAIRLPRLLAFLARAQPDYVCLQELKCVDEQFPFAAVEAAGYHAAVYGQKTYNGVAVLSRTQPLAVQRGFGDGVDDPAARFLAARFPKLTVMAAYIPNGQTVGSDKYFYKLNWFARLRRYLRQSFDPSDAYAVMGDFNVAPLDLDVYDPAALRGSLLCSEAERRALQDLLDDGLTDAFRRLHPTVVDYTWWDYRMLGFAKNHGLRIDMALASGALVKHLRTCRTDRDERKGDKPSDHAPVIATFGAF